MGSPEGELALAETALLFVLSGVVPGLFQRVFVKPDELQRENPYIERNIALTQQAYNLRQITVKPFDFPDLIADIHGLWRFAH